MFQMYRLALVGLLVGTFSDVDTRQPGSFSVNGVVEGGTVNFLPCQRHPMCTRPVH